MSTIQSRKAKGRLLQQHVCKRIREFLRLSENDVVSRPMGSSGRDIMMSDLAFSKLPVAIECKNTKEFPSIAALEQSKANADSYLAAVCWKPPGKGYEKTIIYMYLEDYLEDRSKNI